MRSYVPPLEDGVSKTYICNSCTLRGLSFPPHVFIYPVTYSCQYGLFIIWLVMLLTYVAQIVPTLAIKSSCMFACCSWVLWHIPCVRGLSILRTSSSYVFPGWALEPGISLRNSSCFYWRMVLKTKFRISWVLHCYSVLLLPGPLSWLSKKIHVCTNWCIYLYLYFYKYPLYLF